MRTFLITLILVAATVWGLYQNHKDKKAAEEIQISDSVTPSSLPEISRRNTEPRKVPIRYLVIHGTANDSSYADAAWHHQYLDTTSREVSWHASIDSMGTVTHFPDSLVCYAASSRSMNHQSINVELCQNGGSINLATIVHAKNYILQKKLEYPQIKIIYHDEVGKYVDDARLHGKHCPAKLNSKAREFIRR